MQTSLMLAHSPSHPTPDTPDAQVTYFERYTEQVRLAMASELPIVLPHEHDPIKSGCQFERFFTTTPPDLIRDGLYKKLAFACFPGKKDRLGSLAVIAKLGLGFVASVTSLKDSRAVECFTEVASCGAQQLAGGAHEVVASRQSIVERCKRATKMAPARPRIATSRVKKIIVAMVLKQKADF